MTLNLPLRNIPAVWLTAVILLFTAAVYAPTVRLPFFWDDPVHFRGTSMVSYEYILTHTDLGAYYTRYYRPLVNLLYKTPGELGFLPSPLFWHTTLLALHLLNIALLGALLRFLRVSRIVQFAAMFTFALFPYSVQAVIWVTSFVHPLLMFVMLLASHALLRFLRRPHIGWLALVWLMGLIAPFIHENGVVLAGVLMALALFGGFTLNGRFVVRAALAIAPSAFAAVAYLYILASITNSLPDFLRSAWNFPIWLRTRGLSPLLALTLFGTTISASRPKLRRQWIFAIVAIFATGFLSIFILRDSPVRPRIAYFAQGISYPIQFWTSQITALEPETRAWVGAILFAALVVALWFALKTWAKRRMLLLALAWIAVTITPPLVFLEYDYLVTAPRLFYPLAPGIALLYGLLLETAWERRNTIVRAVSIVVIVLLLLINVTFIRDRMGLYQTLTDAYFELIDALPDDPNARILVINAPRWLASPYNPFSLDRMGAVFMPDYVNLRDFIWTNTGLEYYDITPIADLNRIYWTDRVTGLGEQLWTPPTAEEIAARYDYVYVCMAEGDRIVCRAETED